jgi:sigma-B regulation protein RsbU (phosphoserine phosphatase)
MLFFSVLGILIIYFVITFITNKLVEPLSTVTTQLKEFSNLSGNEISGETMNEVKLVSESLGYLQTWYEKYKINQSQEKKRSSRQMQDLMQASEIQRSLIKTEFPALPKKKEIDLFAIYKPANIVSGDLFDYFLLDDENLVFTMGDVSGKGIPAAIFMSVSQTIIKSSATVKTAKNIVNKANKELFTNNFHQFFLTLFLGVLNLKTGILNYCNAAHTSTILLKNNGETEELGQSHGLPLGLYPDKEYSDSKIKIEKGDTLILFTDGITELQDHQQNMFGIERFKETVRKCSHYPLPEMADKIQQSLEEFRGEVKQIDDISLLILRYEP